MLNHHRACAVVLVVLIVVLLALSPCAALADDASVEALQEAVMSVAEDASQSIVVINVYHEPTNRPSSSMFTGGYKPLLEAQGSGIVVYEGVVLTCWHILQGRGDFTVSAADDVETELAATLIAVDEVRDLALLRVEGLNAPPVRLGDSDALRLGQFVVCVSNPASSRLAASVSFGVVSGLDRKLQSSNVKGETVTLFQTDAAINGGSSGGGIFDLRGELVGIVSRKYVGANGSDIQLEGLGMCIPINEAVEQILFSPIELPNSGHTTLIDY